MMWKEVGRRASSLLLTLVLILGLLPAVTPSAFAADVKGLTDSAIGLESEDGTWTASGTTINGSVTGTAAGTCSSASSKSGALTITNQKGAEATLSFDYALTLNGGSAEIDNKPVTEESGTFSKVLEAGDRVSISITSKEGAYTTSIRLTNVYLLRAGTVSVTFQPGEGGSYTVDGEAVPEAGLTKENETAHPYVLAAAPAEGYQFLGWKTSTGAVLSTDSNATLYFDEDTTVTPWFIPAGTAVFTVDSAYYTDLDAAVQAAQAGGKLVVVAQNGTLAAGSYTIPAGITLLVPFDAANTVYTTEPDNTGSGYDKPTLYRKLTLAPGASITVNGSISVGSKHTGAQTYGPGSSTGPYGQIQLEAGSSITLNSGGKLYAYGYITGSGSVTALPGSEVREYFQIREWRGGTASSSMLSNSQKVFPFSQYYAQNIEAPLTMYAGATETLYTSIYSSWGTQSAEVKFVGDNGLFRLETGAYFTKQYLPEEDRLLVEVWGDLALNEINVQGFGSSSYTLPIHSGMSVVIHSGTASFTSDISLLPGAKLTIDQGAQLNLSASLFVYDAEEWVDKNFVYSNADWRAASYSPTRSYTRTEADLTDVTLDLNGTLTVTGNGGLYTTASGANVISSQNTGKLVLEAAPNASQTLYQATQSGTTISYSKISITPAVLQNGDGTATATVDAAAGTPFFYVAELGKWSPPALYITSTDHKTAYKADEPLDVTGLTILAVKSDGTTETVPVMADMVSGFDSTALIDSLELTISYGGQTTTYTISVSMADGLAIPEGTLTAVKPSVLGAADGKITGTTAAMEYSASSDFTGAVACGAGETTGLAAGIYYVRYAATATHSAGAAATVTIPQGDKPKYLLTIEGGGEDSTGGGSYEEGTLVTIDAGTREGCEFTGWTTTDAEVTFVDPSSTQTTFTMPGHAVIITATWHCHKDAVTKVDGVTATCEQPGTKEYYQCTCGKYYEDADCTVLITDLDTWKVIPALGHDWGAWTVETQATCTEQGQEKRVCARCQKTETRPVDALGHAWADEPTVDVAPTCTTAGSQSYHCTRCEAIKDQTEIPALGHDWGEPVFTWAEDGSSCQVSFTCARSGCGEKETLPATVTPQVSKQPTCTEMGQTTYTAQVSFNSQTYSDSKILTDIPALGHSWGEPVFAWAEDGSSCTVTVACSRDPAHVEHPAAVISSAVKTPATCTEMGQTTYTAQVSFNGETHQDSKTLTDISALGHSWGEPVFAWAEDASSCTVTVTCTRDPAHVEHPAAVISSAVKTPATCTEMGQTTYTAQVSFNGETHQDSKTLTDISALGHSWGEPVFAWAEDGSSCTVTVTCTRDPAHVEHPAAVISSAVKTPATCTAMGVTTYTATAAFGGQEYTNSKDIEDIAMIPHTYGDWQSDGTSHWKECSVCRGKAEEAGHDLKWVVDQPATETETGLKHEECTICGYKRSEGTVIDKLPHVHVDIQHHEAAAATCCAAGTVEYWTCSSPLCAGKYYGDKDCNVELETIEAPVDPDNHAGGTELRDKKEATCTGNGYTGNTWCLGCDTMISQGTVIPALGHNWGDWQSDETNHWKECSVCHSKAEEAPHSFTWVVDKEATTTETGLKHEECTVCGCKRSEGTVINKLPDPSGGSGSAWAPSYTVTTEEEGNGGTASISSTHASKGSTITLTVEAEEGYILESISVIDKNGNEIKLTHKGDNQYTFVMPASNVTVIPVFSKVDTPVDTGLPFTDVNSSDWFCGAVKCVYDSGLMGGISDTLFAPGMTTDRAMVVTILWRLEGSPAADAAAAGFNDVESGTWYAEAVYWAAAEGIVKGYSDAIFAPTDTVTREQLATILHRYAEYKGYDVSQKGSLAAFSDGETTSSWAVEAAEWAIGTGLLSGKGSNVLDPTGSATRAEVAQLFLNFSQNAGKET